VLYDDVAKVETVVGESSYTGDEAATYAKILDRLWTVAAEGDAARRLIIRAADELSQH
jgi:hypothetical protein